ncbi:hypothetical protein EYF80_014890 [Liparis tanakae]|uniref:Uncharacterized protein n=1 Tax=Liparis tanakae TaxID=230148 RepID=A0A4Z2IA83_9TELE|nr:hypothetical protein EYF80_014890 [Liparis tanakae]
MSANKAQEEKTHGRLPVIRHHASHPGSASDPVLDGTTVPAAGRPRPPGGPMARGDAAAHTCRASCNYRDTNE